MVGECHDESSGGSESGGSSSVWEAHCASSVGSFQEGDAVDFVRQEPLTAGEVEHLGLDPSGVYWWWNIVCVRDGAVLAMREIVVAENESVSPGVIRDRVRARLGIVVRTAA